jgi:hypothetical protein
VGPTRQRPNYGQALGRDLETVLAKEVFWIGSHPWILYLILEFIKFLISSIQFMAGR